MAATVLKPTGVKELKKLFALLSSACSETLGSLIARELQARPGDAELVTADDILASISRPNAVVRGALDKDYAGRMLLILVEVQDACAMAGHLMMTPDEVVETRRSKNTLEGEDIEAFGELGNVLCSGLGNVLRDNLANIDIRLHDHGVIKPSLDEKSLLPAGQLVCCRVAFKVGNYPETQARLVVDLETATKWNKGPVDAAVAAPAASAPAAAAAEKKEAPTSKLDEDSLEDIVAAPVKGALNVYLASQEPWRLLRRACRRVGFELRRHGRGEIPNPAAHKGEVVLMDVPPGEERRFDWCKRIKDYNATVKVVLMLHRPSRARVTQAFLSQADVILGWPLEEEALTSKLTAILEAGATTGDAPPAQ